MSFQSEQSTAARFSAVFGRLGLLVLTAFVPFFATHARLSDAQMVDTARPLSAPADAEAAERSTEDRLSASTPGNALPAASLGPDDLIELRVAYCPELSHSFRIAPGGELVLPLLHRAVQVSGLTPAEAASRIREGLVAEQIMPDPIVSLAVLEVRSRPVSVVGAVVHPLTFQITRELTLLDGIALAGGFVPEGASTILVTSNSRKADGTLQVSVREIPARSLMQHADAASNIVLRGGEEICVLEAAKIFVTGNVIKPGAYTMQGNEDTTVLKALALSSGLQQYSSHVAYIYRRRPTGSGREEIAVPLSRIMTRKDPDVALVADDILYIPDNNGKRMTAKVLSQIAGFGQTAGAGVLIYR